MSVGFSAVVRSIIEKINEIYKKIKLKTNIWNIYMKYLHKRNNIQNLLLEWILTVAIAKIKIKKNNLSKIITNM